MRRIYHFADRRIPANSHNSGYSFQDVHSRLLLASFISFLAWIAIPFGHNKALIHQGAYFNNIALIIGTAWIVWDVSRSMFWLALCANALVAFALYAPPHGEIIREAAYWIGCAVVLVAFFAASRAAVRANEGTRCLSEE